ncbi:MAG: hypothetical protein OEY23_15320, partial [Acidimicrobiia bacterium]|nr:hypothetical protein [Acidimicrobiia bacterium]
MDRSALSQLAPSDAVVAIASLPRRFREALDPDDRRPGADPGRVTAGVSPVGLIEATARALTTLREALARALVVDGAQFPASLFDRDERDHPGQGGDVGAALGALEAAANALADQVKRAPASG